jgi:hypothetical protein
MIEMDPLQVEEQSRVFLDISAERRRQIEVEGWTPWHDDQHSNSDLATAAACYAAPDRVAWPTPEEERRGVPVAYGNALRWPWERFCWKPRDRRSNLVRAAALIVAEIERLDRLAATQQAAEAEASAALTSGGDDGR